MFLKNSLIMVIFAALYMLNKCHLIEIRQFESFQCSYFNDILAPLVLTPLFINIHIIAAKRRNDLAPCLLEVAAYFFLLSVFFECLVPIYNSRSVAYFYYVMAYFVGSTIYFSLVGAKVYHLEWLPFGLRLKSG